MADGEDSETDIDIPSIARAEAHRTLDTQIETLNDIDDKAARLLRINLVVLGILLSGLSVAANLHTGGAESQIPVVVSDAVNGFTISGFVLLIASTAVAAATFSASDQRIGMSGTDLRYLLDNDHTDLENLEGVVESYSRWIDHNYRTNARNAPLGTLMLLLLIYSISAFSLGVKQTIDGSVELWLLTAVIVSNVALTWHTRFHRQIRRLLRLWYRRRTKDSS